jgi:hypothetical protein
MIPDSHIPAQFATIKRRFVDGITNDQECKAELSSLYPDPAAAKEAWNKIWPSRIATIHRGIVTRGY